MKKDAEVKLYMKERAKSASQPVAAACSGMSEQTACKRCILRSVGLTVPIVRLPIAFSCSLMV